MEYHYRVDVREALLARGIRVTTTTPPELARSHLNDLYRFEIRQLRRRLRRHEIPRPDYARHVVTLRRRYPLLSVPTPLWTRASPSDD